MVLIGNKGGVKEKSYHKEVFLNMTIHRILFGLTGVISDLDDSEEGRLVVPIQ